MNKTAEDSGVLSSEMKELLQKIAAETGALPDPTTLPPQEGRDQTARTNARWNVAMPDMRQIEEIWIDSDPDLGSARTRLRLLVPYEYDAGVILFVHGGGFAFCSPETHERYGRVLAVESRSAVVMPDYRLAPENPFPAGLRDVVASLRAVLGGDLAGLRPGPVLVAGDSAGANLAVAAMLHEQSKARRLPGGALLFYGNYAFSLDGLSYLRFRNGPGLTLARIEHYWKWYSSGRALENETLACPLRASDAELAALPPLFLVAAGVDPLQSDTLALHERLKALGRSDELLLVPGVTHGFLQYSVELQAARETLSSAGLAARQMRMAAVHHDQS